MLTSRVRSNKLREIVLRTLLLVGISISLVVLSSCNGCTSQQQSNTVSPTTPTVGEESGEREFQEFTANSSVPVLEGDCVDGSHVALTDYRGKTVLLNFWATWCIPCVAEMPALERVYRKFKDRGLVILAVSVDQDPSLVSDFVKQNGITFPVILDSEFSRAQRFGISGFPETFFVSPEGTFLSTKDPETSNEGVRIISDRAWDSEDYLTFIEKLLPK